VFVSCLYYRWCCWYNVLHATIKYWRSSCSDVIIDGGECTWQLGISHVGAPRTRHVWGKPSQQNQRLANSETHTREPRMALLILARRLSCSLCMPQHMCQGATLSTCPFTLVGSTTWLRPTP